MLDKVHVHRILSGTCGICYLDVSPQEYVADKDRQSFHIIGTGFLVRPTTVITNRHVILGLREIQKQGVSPDQVYLWFAYPRPGGLQEAYCRFKHHGVVLNEEMDIGPIEFTRRPEPEFEQCQPLDIADQCEPQIGMPISVCGFPYGDDGLHLEDGRFYRHGPVFQFGFISAIAPHTYSPPKGIREILLDVRTAAGMSGSPVIALSDAKVVGVHYSGIEATTAFAIPIDHERLRLWLDAHDATLSE
jgi:S1-C subfamily serine protease